MSYIWITKTAKELEAQVELLKDQVKEDSWKILASLVSIFSTLASFMNENVSGIRDFRTRSVMHSP